MKNKLIIMMLLGICSSCTAIAASYQYDELGRVVSVKYADNMSVSYSYDTNGNLLTGIADKQENPPDETPIPEKTPTPEEPDTTPEPEETPEPDINTDSKLIPVQKIAMKETYEKKYVSNGKGHEKNKDNPGQSRKAEKNKGNQKAEYIEVNMQTDKDPTKDNYILGQFYHLFDEQTENMTPQIPSAASELSPQTKWRTNGKPL